MRNYPGAAAVAFVNESLRSQSAGSNSGGNVSVIVPLA